MRSSTSSRSPSLGWTSIHISRSAARRVVAIWNWCWPSSPARARRVKALVVSTGVPHHTAMDLFLKAFLAKPLPGCPTHNGTIALVSQNASTFFTFFLDTSPQLCQGDLRCRHSEERLQIQSLLWQSHQTLRRQFQKSFTEVFDT